MMLLLDLVRLPIEETTLLKVLSLTQRAQTDWHDRGRATLELFPEKILMSMRLSEGALIN